MNSRATRVTEECRPEPKGKGLKTESSECGAKASYIVMRKGPLVGIHGRKRFK